MRGDRARSPHPLPAPPCRAHSARLRSCRAGRGGLPLGSGACPRLLGASHCSCCCCEREPPVWPSQGHLGHFRDSWRCLLSPTHPTPPLRPHPPGSPFPLPQSPPPLPPAAPLPASHPPLAPAPSSPSPHARARKPAWRTARGATKGVPRAAATRRYRPNPQLRCAAPAEPACCPRRACCLLSALSLSEDARSADAAPAASLPPPLAPSSLPPRSCVISCGRLCAGIPNNGRQRRSEPRRGCPVAGARPHRRPATAPSSASLFGVSFVG